MGSRIIALAVALLLVGSLAALAIEWKVIDSGADVVVDSKTGLPAVVFHVAVEYSEVPVSTDMSGNWEAFKYVNGTKVPIRITPSTAVLRGDVWRIYTTTSHIVTEEGVRYEATVTLADDANGLSYIHTFNFTASGASPYGIALRGWDGSENIDLSELPDEELEELVLLHNLLSGYIQSPIVQTVKAFLRGDAAAKPDTAVLLNGALDDEEAEEIDRCTYTACGIGCCSTCVEHAETADEPPTEESQTPAPDVRIDCIVYQSEDFEHDAGEYVQIKNYGDASQDLLGWTLYNLNHPDKAFTFPESFVLEPDQSIRVYTNEVHDESGGFSFESEDGVWQNVVAYPVSLILIPMPDSNMQSSGTGIRLSVVLTLYMYSLASQDDISPILNQLAQFDQDFSGQLYYGSGSSILGGGKTIFVQDIAVPILDAAAAEIKNR